MFKRAFISGFLKQAAVVYHGSPNKLDKLEPKNYHGDPDVKDAIFATPHYDMAMTYLNKWNDKDFAQQVVDQLTDKPTQVIMSEARPGALEEIYSRPGYLYELPNNTFVSPNRAGNMSEVVSYLPVNPVKTTYIENVLDALRANPNIVLNEYDPTSKDIYNAIKFQVARSLQMTPENREQYHRWRLEGAPEEIKKLFMEELARQQKLEV